MHSSCRHGKTCHVALRLFRRPGSGRFVIMRRGSEQVGDGGLQEGGDACEKEGRGKAPGGLPTAPCAGGNPEFKGRAIAFESACLADAAKIGGKGAAHGGIGGLKDFRGEGYASRSDLSGWRPRHAGGLVQPFHFSGTRPKGAEKRFECLIGVSSETPDKPCHVLPFEVRRNPEKTRWGVGKQCRLPLGSCCGLSSGRRPHASYSILAAESGI